VCNCPQDCKSCTDTDGGKNYYLQGYAYSSSHPQKEIDFCDNSFANMNMREYYCDENGNVQSTQFNCPNGCSDGACIKESCSDSDGGVNPYISGYCTDSRGTFYDGCLSATGVGPSTQGTYVLESFCMTDAMIEHCKKYNSAEYCNNLPRWCYQAPLIAGNIEWTYFDKNDSLLCLNSCSNGACLQTVSPEGISLRDAKYTAGGSGSDKFNVTIVNGGADIDLSNYQLIFTGNGYQIVIDNTQYQVTNLIGSGIVAFGTSKELQADSSQFYNPIISTNQCGTTIKVGLITRSGTTQGDILVMQDMILSCASVCTNGETKQCGYPGLGACNKYGTSTCINGNWGACTGLVYPTTEICGNGIDDDCDGQVDEGC
jgi:hypothetical protein